jgi:ankyrin repeat protein
MKDFNIPKIIFLAVTISFAVSMFKIYFPNKKEITSHSAKKFQKQDQDKSQSHRPKSYDFKKDSPIQDTTIITKEIRELEKTPKNFQRILEYKNDQLAADYIKSINPSHIYKSDLMTPLMLLIEADMEDTFLKALKKVASADIDHQNKYGASALVLSSGGGNLRMVKALLERGANPNIKFNKRNYTLLMDASFEGHIELVKLLLEAGAELNIQDKDGRTALILAAREGHDLVVSELVKFGARIELKDKNQMSAKDYAFKNNFKEVLKHLK